MMDGLLKMIASTVKPRLRVTTARFTPRVRSAGMARMRLAGMARIIPPTMARGAGTPWLAMSWAEKSAPRPPMAYWPRESWPA